jgi:hypothetical protein
MTPGGAESYYAIHEVYYDENGRPHSVTNDPVPAFGETVDELRTSYDMMREAFEQPVLDYASFAHSREEDE